MSHTTDGTGWILVLRDTVESLGGTDLPSWLVELIERECAQRCNAALRGYANRTTAALHRMPMPRDEAAVHALLAAEGQAASVELVDAFWEAQDLLCGPAGETTH